LNINQIKDYITIFSNYTSDSYTTPLRSTRFFLNQKMFASRL